MRAIYLFVSLCVGLIGKDFVVSKGFVIDRTHNMMWQDTQDNIKILVSQTDAEKYCKNLALGGYSNWRVPTVDEYEYIINRKRDDEIMIDRSFRYILQDGYWTSDRTWRNFGRWGYYIYFKSGSAYYENRTYSKYIRCIRDQ
ncbi:MAG: DUF1566 domain-containing protein [Campylobacterota bacterium]|nr:DUF1566 domain-containing protein [Campylobacterota bacterium]